MALRAVAAQLDRLPQYGCVAYQDRLFAEPLPMAEFDEFVRRNDTQDEATIACRISTVANEVGAPRQRFSAAYSTSDAVERHILS